MIATAPGKLILTGEYAVLDGAPALVIAIDRRVIAQRGIPDRDTPFLAAVAEELARRGDTAAAHAAAEIVVDSSAFYSDGGKLGLGSSAAVTVAATALALGPWEDALEESPRTAARMPEKRPPTGRQAPPRLDRTRILEIALAAHAAAQGPRGARGSGADVAAAVHGGALVFTPAPHPRIDPRRWPSGVTLLPFFTGRAADTATLVAEVNRARAARAAAVGAALGAIADASRAACAALDDELISALAMAAAATRQLARATGLPLVPDCVIAAQAALRPFGGTAKTTGAGGGDVAIGVIPARMDVTAATRALIEAGCQPLRLSLDETGVDLRPDPQ